MSSKTKQYVLLGLVAVIWAVVIIRFVDLTGGDEEQLAPIRLSHTPAASANIEQYKFRLNYADPFLKTFATPEPVVIRQPEERPRRTSFERIPQIQLRGVVQGSVDNTALVEVEGKLFMVKKGEEFRGFKLMAMDLKEVKVRHMSSDSVMVLSHLATSSFTE